MAAYFIELNSQIYLRITGSTTHVIFASAVEASYSYNLFINGLVTITRNDNQGVAFAVTQNYDYLVTGSNGNGSVYTPTNTDFLLCVGNTVLVAQGGNRAHPGSIPLNSLNVKYNGIWKNVKSVYTKVGGTWRQCEKIWNNVGGTWRLSYEVPTSDWVNMLEGLDDVLDFAVRVLAYDYDPTPPPEDPPPYNDSGN